MLCTISARDILADIFTPEELNGLPLDTKVAMQHPSPGCEDIKVVFGSDIYATLGQKVQECSN